MLIKTNPTGILRRNFVFLAMFLLFMPFSYAALSDNIVAVWHFEETSGHALDSVGANNSLSETVTSKNQAGISGNAWSYVFASSNNVQFPYSVLHGLTSYAVNCWATRSSAVDGSLWAGSEDAASYSNFFNVEPDNNIYWRTKKIDTTVTSINPASPYIGIDGVHWVMYTATSDGVNLYLYVNGTFITSSSTTNSGIDTDGNNFFIGARGSAGAYWQGKIDECYIWARNLSSTDVTQLYNSGSGFFYPFVTTYLNVLLLNKQYQNTTTLLTNQSFFPAANYTSSGSPVPSAVCNFSASNISAHLEDARTANFTINNGVNYTQSYAESSTNVKEDIFHFRICEGTLKTNVYVHVNGVQFAEIPASVIPTCGGDLFHDYFNRTSQFNTSNTLNITVSCPACSTPRTATLLSKDNLFYAERFITQHSENLTYNSTSHLHAFTQHLYRFTTPTSAGHINVTCDGTLSENSFAVTSALPFVTILQVGNVTPFVNGSQIESQNLTEITIDARNSIFSAISLNISYQNGTLIKSTTQENISLTNKELIENGIYNISASALDIFGTLATASGWFRLNDTTKPSITWLTPASNGTTQENGSTLNLNAVMHDVNLFYYQVAVYDTDGIMVKNTSVTGITAETATYLEAVILNKTGLWIAKAITYDSHTGEDISTLKATKDDNVLSFRNSENNMLGEEVRITYESGSIDTIKEPDRYAFSASNGLYADTKEGSTYQDVFLINCTGIYRIESSHIAHFVCFDAKMWIDFDNSGVIEWDYDMLDANTAQITLTKLKTGNISSSEQIYHSIGLLNRAESDISFDVEVPTGGYPISLASSIFNVSLFDLTTISGVLMLMFVFLIWLALLIVGEVTGIPFIMIFTILAGIFDGILIFVGVSGVLGMLFIIMNLLYIIRVWMGITR